MIGVAFAIMAWWIFDSIGKPSKHDDDDGF